MNLSSNPYVKAELDNLMLQFGTKALLDLDDYCALFKTCRAKASLHLKNRGIPSIKIGQDVYIPIQDLALFLAQKKAEREGRLILTPVAKGEARKNGGFARKANEAQLIGTGK